MRGNIHSPLGRVCLWIPGQKAGNGTGGSVKPVMAAAAASTEAREEDLVASAQAGNVEAFEALFRRYRERMTGFVRASIRDEGRAEDLVQEIFLSAHNSLPTLSHPAAFRTWLYQIARNACLDEVRRRSRQDELIYGWEDFPPPDERIVVHNQDAGRTFSQKEELADLTQALDGLPPTQHEALVLRELEGRSYDEIGRRMRLSKTAVESVLFRARRSLRGEYAEIQTGERCKRMQLVMAGVAEGMGDLRERRKLIRHMRDCSRCRREAATLGLAGLAVPSDDRRGLERAFSRVAAFLPLPAFFSRRGGEAEPLAGSGGSFAAQAQGAAAQLSTVGADHAVSVVHKAAAVVAAVAVVGGGGVAIQKAGVDLPVLSSIVKKHDGKASPTGDGSGAAKAPAGSAGAGGLGSPAGPKAPSGSSHQAPAAAALGGSQPAGQGAPATGAPADITSPDPGASAPSDSAPSDSTTTGPAGSGDTKTKSGTGTGDTTTGSDPGGTKKKQTESDSTPTGGDTNSATPTDAVLQLLPPGLAKQIASGKRTIDELPPGQKKKLPPPADTAGAAATP
jgi:RNA polymerase sigma factor (sigma-70 family)